MRLMIKDIIRKKNEFINILYENNIKLRLLMLINIKKSKKKYYLLRE
jgi:hypothetical protein